MTSSTPDVILNFKRKRYQHLKWCVEQGSKYQYTSFVQTCAEEMERLVWEYGPEVKKPPQTYAETLWQRKKS